MTTAHHREIIASIPDLKDAQVIAIAMQIRRYQEINLRAAINSEQNQDDPRETSGILRHIQETRNVVPFRNHAEEIDAAIKATEPEGAS